MTEMANFSYMVGGLICDKLTPEMEEEKLNQCAAQGWELVQVVVKKCFGCDYTFFYFRRLETGDSPKENPRFDIFNIS